MLVRIDAQANRNNCQNHQQLAHDCQSQTTEPWKEEDLYETVLTNIWQVFIAVCLSGVYFIVNIFFPFLTSIHFWVMGENASLSQMNMRNGRVWRFGTLLEGNLAVLWGCPVHSPTTRTPAKFCPNSGLNWETLCSSAPSPTDWPSNWLK